MKTPLSFSLAMTAIMLAATATVGTLTSCEKKPTTIGEKIDDALDARPNEKIKDAAENVGEAARDAKDAVKDAVKD